LVPTLPVRPVSQGTRRCHLGTRPAHAIIAMEVIVEYRISIDIAAPPDVVWPVMADGERWPEWTPSVRSVTRLDKGPLRVGSRALIRQPRFPPAVWKVTTLEPGRRFVWKSGLPGMWVYGDHSVEPIPTGTRATLRLTYDGALARLMGRLTRDITNRYLTMEATGLKKRSETNAAIGTAARLTEAAQ
jgi:uncharacterized membrane protein